MKKFLLLTIVACAFLSAKEYWGGYVNVKKEGQEYLVFADTALVRSAPGTKKAKSFTLIEGDRVTVLAKTDDLESIAGTKEYWYRVSAAGQKGYIWGGLLADDYAEIDSLTILVRNNGVQKNTLGLKVLGPGDRTARTEIESGPVNCDNGLEISKINTADFDPAPRIIFSLGFFVFSEIERGNDCRTLCTLNNDGILKTHFSWIPSSCDPPVAEETFILFPPDSLPDLAEAKRPSYHGIKNGIRLVSHDYDLGDSTAHDYYLKDYLWTGSEFVAQ